MTSSPGELPPPYEAIVCREDRVLGPVRLPPEDPDQFVVEFNRIYQRAGMRMEAIPHTSGPIRIETNPPSSL